MSYGNKRNYSVDAYAQCKRDFVPFLVYLTIAFSLAFLLGGCAHKLAPDGVYKGNSALYAQDDAIVLANRGLKSFLSWELRNRAILPASVSRSADHVRTNLFEWNQKALRTRDAFAAVPSDENKVILRAALNELQQALTEATIVIAEQKGKNDALQKRTRSKER